MLAIVGLAAASAILIPTYAAPQIKSADIVDGEVKTVDLADDAVTSPTIKNGGVATEDIASGAVKPNVKMAEGHYVVVDPSEVGYATADCPTGYTLTGGGYRAGNLIDVDTSAPVRDEEGFANSWIAGGINEDDQNQADFSAFAICMGPSP
jgi:hypothetical protein